MSSNAVTAALAAGVFERGLLLASAPEDQWFDRKAIEIKPTKLAETITALANADGGLVVVGISEGKVQGVDAEPQRVNAIRQSSIDFIRPQVPLKVELLECRTSTGQSDHVIVISVQPSEVVHETADGQCYLRVGDETRKLTFAHRQELEFDRGHAKYEAQRLAGRTLVNLDGGLVVSYKKAAGASAPTEQFLASRGLLTQQLEVTNGAYLLFARHPQDMFPNAHVRVLKFLGTTRGTGARLALDEDADFRVEGPIPAVISQAASIIEDLMPVRRALGHEGLFVGEPIVPREAWLEGLVNAVVHRSYSIAGDSIRVEIYEDRIEIVSPGRFPGLADLTKPLDVVRYARNPRIARVCADLRITQELGEGIHRIFDEMRSRGLEDPLYEQGSSHVRLTLSSRQRLNDQVAGNLAVAAREMLRGIRRAARPVTTGDVVEITGRSRPTVLKHLNVLREVGLIKWVGTNSNDPTATWEPTD